MKRFAIYREVKKQPREAWLRKRPTRVSTVEAESAYDAAVAYCDTLAERGWRDPIIEHGYRRTTATIWIRKFTPTGRYRGETSFWVMQLDSPHKP